MNRWDPTGLWEIDYQTGTATVEPGDTIWSLYQELQANGATNAGWGGFQNTVGYFNNWNRGGRGLGQLAVGESIRFGFDQNSLFIGFDGTANHFQEADDNGGTNVAAMFFLSRGQRRYIPGVGNSIEFGRIDAFYGKVEGWGLNAKVNEGLAHVRAAYAQGIRRVDAVGFSRGGATAVEFGMRLNDLIADGQFPGLQVGFLGLFDVVPGLHKDLAGYGNQQATVRHLPPTPDNTYALLDMPLANFQNFRVQLPQSGGGSPLLAVHLVAMDEARTDFQVLNVQGALQVGVFGDHSDICGGHASKGLSNIYLRGMIDAARRSGVDMFTVQEGLQAARRAGNATEAARLSRFLPVDQTMAPHRIYRAADVPWWGYALSPAGGYAAQRATTYDHGPRYFPWLDHRPAGWQPPTIWRNGDFVFRHNNYTRD